MSEATERPNATDPPVNSGGGGTKVNTGGDGTTPQTESIDPYDGIAIDPPSNTGGGG